MQFAVIDDEDAALEWISEKLTAFAADKNIAVSVDCFQTTAAFQKVYKPNLYQAVFLDIDMPQQYGFQFAKSLRAMGDEIPVIFVTNREDLVIHAFRYQAMGFVRKQYLDTELPFALSTLVDALAQYRDTITVTELRSQGGNTQIVLIRNILYIEVCNHHTCIHLADGNTLTVRKPLSDYTASEGFENFVQINSGTLVNLSAVKLDGARILLPDETVLYISKRKMDTVRCAYLNSLKKVLV